MENKRKNYDSLNEESMDSGYSEHEGKLIERRKNQIEEGLLSPLDIYIR